MKLSIIIPVHKINKIVLECIEIIYNQIKNHELIIACDKIDFSFKNAKIIKSDKKLYANKIRNFAAKSTSGDYIIFMDSDIIVKNNFIEEIEKYIKNNNLEILNFPTESEKSNNIFAKYKGFKENYQTYQLMIKNYNNIKAPFYGYAVIFKKNIFFELGGWPEKGVFDYIMEHEGFQKIIYNSKYKNEIAFDIQVKHYHHKNIDLFINIVLRTRIWILKKLRGEVDIDAFKSKKNAFNSFLIFFSFLTLFVNLKISLFLILIYVISDLDFIFFLLKKTKLLFPIFFFIHWIYFICIFLGASIGTVEHIILKK